MNQVSEGGTSDAPLTVPMKRKRGRPRKDRTLLPGPTAAVAPPGFARVHQTPTLQLDAVDDASKTIVGQPVTGVVESVFDAGYILSVRIGNSSTRFRGLVFKPGHYVPVSPENDIAPHVQMLRRNEVQIPTRIKGRPRGRHARKQVNLGGTEVGQLLNGSPQAGDMMGSKGKEVTVASPISAALPVGFRGTVVPVLLQPASAPNGLPTVNPAPVLGQQPQTSSNQVLSGGGGENKAREEGKKVPVSSQAAEAGAENVLEAGQSSVGRSSSPLVGNLNNPLSVEPLQAAHSSGNNGNNQGVNASDSSRIGGMSVLLQALQENMTE